VSSTVTGTVRDLSVAGEGIVPTDRGMVFVPGVLPRERVEIAVAIGKKRGKTLRGRLVRLIEPSTDRVTPPCDYASQCGGCPLMTLSLPGQLDHKRTIASRAAGVTVELVETGDALGYRHRGRLQWIATGGGPVVGYCAARSTRIVQVDRCVVLEPALDRLRLALIKTLGPFLAGEGAMSVSIGGGRGYARLESEGPQPAALYRALETAVTEGTLAGAALRCAGASPAHFGEAYENQASMRAPIGGFSQAHREGNPRLVDTVVALADCADQTVLELYAGHGNFTLPLARHARSVEAVEVDVGQAGALAFNLAAHLIENVAVRQGSAETFASGKPIDVVVLDPPRTGAKAILSAIAARAPKKIVYVSCDMPTLGRDRSLLEAQGYRVDRAYVLDMFPHTAHVEAVVRLVQRAPR